MNNTSADSSAGSGADAEPAACSALVIMSARSDRLPGGSAITPEAATAETIARLQPDPAAVQSAMDQMEAAGFDLGPFVGISFSITGPKDLFEETFGVDLVVDEDQTISVVGVDEGQPVDQIPHDRLQSTIADVVDAVVFERRASTDPQP